MNKSSFKKEKQWKGQHSSSFNATVAFIPDFLDIRSVSTAAHWVLLSHIVMPLLRVSGSGEYEGYLAKSWQASADFTEFDFILADKYFSDGLKIRPEHVVATIKSQMQKGETIHFDFRRIAQVLQTGEESIRIRLKQPDNHFLAQAALPEFGVQHPSEIELNEGMRCFQISSGPYFVVPHNEDSILLERNKFYPGWLEGAPERINFYGSQHVNVVNMILNGSLDCVEAFVDPEPHKAAMSRNFQSFHPRLTQSAWVGVNGRSPIFRSIENRKYLQHLILSSNISLDDLRPGVEPTDQLFVPGSPARFSAEELNDLYRPALSQTKPQNFPSKLTIAGIEGRPVAPRVAAALKTNGVETEYAPFDLRNIGSVLRNADYDVIVINNDFSSAHMLENLLVAINSEVPLIRLPPDSSVPGLLEKSSIIFDEHTRNSLAKEVAHSLISEGVITPIAYYNYILYVNADWDISRWSLETGETPLWQIRKKK